MTMHEAVIDLTLQLIRRRTLTPEDAGCQTLIAQRLTGAGFNAETVRFGEVDNLWLRRGNTAPLLAFAGHTDVVPPGPLADWHCDPFEPQLRDGVIYGRGAADMKGGLAAWVCACERFAADHPDHHGSMALLITSDEEGPCRDGTRRMIPWLQDRGETIDWCVVGEASSERELGDTIKNGRRGSLSGVLHVRGRQSHIAYARAGDNPIHSLAPALAELCATHWDHGNDYFPPTSFQVSDIRAGTGAENVVPGTAEVHFNFRYSTELTQENLQSRVAELLNRYPIDYRIDWRHRGEPFLTREGRFTETVSNAVRTVTGRRPQLSTTGGTSDGRFIAPTGTQVVELGPINASIHRVNEHVAAADLQALTRIYYAIMEALLLDA